MKKIIILFTIVLIFTFAYLWIKQLYPVKTEHSPYLDPNIKFTAVTQPDPDALGNLKVNLPYADPSFTAAWNVTTNQVDLTMFKPYDQAVKNIFLWQDKIKAINLPLGTINIIKK